MWQRYTDEARRTVYHADAAARRLGSEHVDTEHFLLGVLEGTDNDACRILEALGSAPNRVRDAIERQLTSGDAQTNGDLSLTPEGKLVLDLAYDEATKTFGDENIGPEHLLLGLIRESNGLAARTLTEIGVRLESARQKVRDLRHAIEDNQATGEA